jgi:hypothetical protein
MPTSRTTRWIGNPETGIDKRETVMHTQPAPDVSSTDVDRVVSRDFAPEQRAQALATLRRHGMEDWQREADRVRLAALKLAAGSLARLSSAIEAATMDYRDVLGPAEYPACTKRAFRIDALPAEERARIIDDDWMQYQDGLAR